MLNKQRFSGLSRLESEETARAWLATRTGTVKVASVISRQQITRTGGLGPCYMSGNWETLIDYEDAAAGKQ